MPVQYRICSQFQVIVLCMKASVFREIWSFINLFSFRKVEKCARDAENSPPSPGPPSPPSRLLRPRPDHRDEMSRPVSPRCCRWWGWRGRVRNPFRMFLSLTIKNVGKFDLKYLKCYYVSVLLGDCREYVVRVWAHIGWNSQQRYEWIANFYLLINNKHSFFINHKSILTVVIFRIKREEFWENIVEQLLSDETTWALRLENSVEPLHLSFAKSKMR